MSKHTYGDIDKVDTTGASPSTSRQDNSRYTGVRASHEMAQTDSGRMERFRRKIEQAACDLRMDPAVIAGIISRETRAGNALRSSAYGADGHGYGVMQVDDRYHTVVGGPESLEHIKQGTGILIDMIKAISAAHPTWTKEMKLKGGLSAYNCGPSNVKTYEGMDNRTTAKDYANDVTARAQWYSQKDGYN